MKTKEKNRSTSNKQKLEKYSFDMLFRDDENFDFGSMPSIYAVSNSSSKTLAVPKKKKKISKSKHDVSILTSKYNFHEECKKKFIKKAKKKNFPGRKNKQIKNRKPKNSTKSTSSTQEAKSKSLRTARIGSWIRNYSYLNDSIYSLSQSSNSGSKYTSPKPINKDKAELCNEPNNDLRVSNDSNRASFRKSGSENDIYIEKLLSIHSRLSDLSQKSKDENIRYSSEKMSRWQKSYNPSDGRFNSSINDFMYNQNFQNQRSLDKFIRPSSEIKKPQKIYRYNDRIPKINEHYYGTHVNFEHNNSNHERNRDYIVVDVDSYRDGYNYGHRELPSDEVKIQMPGYPNNSCSSNESEGLKSAFGNATFMDYLIMKENRPKLKSCAPFYQNPKFRNKKDKNSQFHQDAASFRAGLTRNAYFDYKSHLYKKPQNYEEFSKKDSYERYKYDNYAQNFDRYNNRDIYYNEKCVRNSEIPLNYLLKRKKEFYDDVKSRSTGNSNGNGDIISVDDISDYGNGRQRRNKVFNDNSYFLDRSNPNRNIHKHRFTGENSKNRTHIGRVSIESISYGSVPENFSNSFHDLESYNKASQKVLPISNYLKSGSSKEYKRNSKDIKKSKPPILKARLPKKKKSNSSKSHTQTKKKSIPELKKKDKDVEKKSSSQKLKGKKSKESIQSSKRKSENKLENYGKYQNYNKKEKSLADINDFGYFNPAESKYNNDMDYNQTREIEKGNQKGILCCFNKPLSY
ncbi:hypothetical protein AYI69_g10760 [Smittium culicis]|uniref:Uncharacterized protein n=1 Tax=Smittium culicis TaxID=133412 RepID=A0A1R1X3R6_9FUNG|nr:hypothetical protein AYI69_g10760 [Smittium culicis]